jgi:RimJ/RimL family protein N-acetyltransferase
MYALAAARTCSRHLLLTVPLPIPDPSLVAEGVVLRLPNDGDAEWITRACNDPEIARFVVGMPSPYTEADARRFLEQVKDGWESGTEAVFVIEGAADGDALGLVELHLASHDRMLGILGYWLRAEARGRGAATVGVQLVSRWAFRELEMQRLQLTTAPDNDASQRVAERAGFTREGLLRGWKPTKSGRRDSVMFSLLPVDLAETDGVDVSRRARCASRDVSR